jgi:hypothetical protein
MLLRGSPSSSCKDQEVAARTGRVSARSELKHLDIYVRTLSHGP